MPLGDTGFAACDFPLNDEAPAEGRRWPAGQR